MRFCLVSTRSVPAETGDLLRQACEARNIPFDGIEANTFDFDPVHKLSAGDLLYNAATSLAAARVEQFLYSRQVATFHSTPSGVFSRPSTPSLVAEAAGVHVVPTVDVASRDTKRLTRYTERLGGFPVVIKVLGRSSGIGVMIAESMASLS